MARRQWMWVMAIALVGCHGQGGSSSGTGAAPSPTIPICSVLVSGVPTLDGFAHPAGTPLADGLHVPAGAVLLGEPLPPSSQAPDASRAWTATFVVPGSPAEVVRDLVGQLHGRGFSPTSNCRIDDPGVEQCYVAGTKATNGGGETVTAQLVRSRTTSAMTMQFTVTRVAPTFSRFDEETVAHPPPTGPWPDLPEVGDRLVPAGRWSEEEVRRGGNPMAALRLVAGSRMVGPIGFEPTAVLVVDTPHPGTIVAAYARTGVKALGQYGKVLARHRRSAGGAAVSSVEVGQEGDDQRLVLTTVTRVGHPTWLVVTYIAD